MKKYGIWILVLVLISCKTEIELEQAEYEPKIVVDGSIESNDYAQVFLTLSSPFLTGYDSVSITKTFLKYAKVTLSSSNGETEILKLFRQNDLFPPFVYKSVQIKGETGCTYQLKVEITGKVITATTSIPEAPSVSGLSMEAVSDSSGKLIAMIKPSAMNDSRLFIQTKSLKTDKGFHPSRRPVIYLPAGNTDLKIHIQRSPETNIRSMDTDKLKNTFYYNWDWNLYSTKDTVMVKIGTLDIESYQVLKSIFNNQTDQMNPFSFNSAGIQTNIVGGIGRWTGIGIAEVKVYYRNKDVQLKTEDR